MGGWSDQASFNAARRDTPSIAPHEGIRKPVSYMALGEAISSLSCFEETKKHRMFVSLIVLKPKLRYLDENTPNGLSTNTQCVFSSVYSL